MLDVETMMLVLREHRQTGRLTASVPSGGTGFKEPCEVVITVGEGSLRSCLVMSRSGQLLLQGEPALQSLTKAGRLKWTFHAQVVSPPHVSHPAFTTSGVLTAVPRRLVIVPSEQIAAWPRVTRNVFRTIDGQKSGYQIAQMLSTSESVVEQVLRDLSSKHVISLGHQSGE